MRVILRFIRVKTEFHNANGQKWPNSDEFKDFDKIQLLLGPLYASLCRLVLGVGLYLNKYSILSELLRKKWNQGGTE